jgi:putative glutamine amidotransferase
MRPLIGITTSEVRPQTYAHQAPVDEPFRAEMGLGIVYTNALELAGATPVVLPPLGEQTIDDLLDRVDAIVLSGGPDVDPAEYGAEPDPQLGPTWRRLDRFELALARAADARAMPILGICRGCQVLNVARGGDLIQHIGSDGTSSELHHRQRFRGERWTHPIEIEPDSRLARAIGTTELRVNSFHHQSVRTLGRGLRATAHAPDGVIEAMEDAERPFCIGVQWHAEFDTERSPGIALLRSLVEAAVTSAASG